MQPQGASCSGRKFWPTALGVLCAAQLAAHPAAGAQLKFLDKAALSGIGLRLRIMSNAREIPLPAPLAHTYMFTSGTQRKKVEMYRPYDLWISDQHAARWQDRYGNILTIALVRHPFPVGFPREHVTPGDYKTRADQTKIPANWSPRDLADWLAVMCEISGITAEAIAKTSTRFSSLVRFSFPADERRIAYAFQMNPKAIGQKDAGKEYFVASFEIDDAVDLKEAESLVRRKFLSYVAYIPPAQRKSKKQASRKFQARREAPRGERSSAYQASLDRVTSSIANMKDWWYAETTHYILISNAKRKQRRTIKEIQVGLGHLRLAFEKLIPPRKPIEAVSIIRFFGDDEAYQAYVGPKYEWSAGLWSSSRKELIIRPVDKATGQAQHRMILSTAYHESFHQYLFYALDEAQTSPWFNEGHACLFESSDIQKRGVTIDENAAHVRMMIAFMKKDDADLQTMMLLSYEDFYGNDDETRDRNYSLSWGLIYFLRKGVPLDRRSPYANLLNTYVDAIAGGRDAATVTRELLGSVDLEKFQQDFEMFWRSSSRRNAAKRTRIISNRQPRPR